MDRPEPQRYSTTAIILHWAIAALLLFQLALGWRLEDLPKGAAEFAGYQLHKSIGIAILLLSLGRLGIRWIFPRPAPVAGSPAAMLLARLVHGLLYAVMIGGPLTGWILVSTAKIKLQTMLFGLVPWPSLPLGHGWHEPAELVHELIAWLFAGLFVLHVAGALRHHFLRSDMIGRMLPATIASHRALSAAAVVALIGAMLAFSAARIWPFGSSQAAAPKLPASEEAAFQPAAAASAVPAAASGSETAPSEAASADASATPSSVEVAAAWRLEPGGRLGFRADYTGSPVNGSFTRWDADIVFSPEDLAGSSIRVSIDLASVDSAESERDDMLRSSSFFDIGAHPRATFVSSSIRARGPGRYVANGTLTLHGRSRPVAVNFNLDIAGNRATATGSASIQRTAFGVGSGEWSGTDQIADRVAINFSLQARKQ